jgi:outer membrane lipoprotein-sorting protein
MISRRAFTGGALGAIATTLRPRTARADDLDAILAEVAKARAGVKTLKGPFSQERTVGLLATKVRSAGSFVLVRPDRLRWELAPPDEVTYWVAPEGLAYASKTGRGAIPSSGARIGAALEDLRTILGGDLGKLRERYDLRGARADSGESTIEATPKTPGRGLQRFSLTIAADKVRPVRAVLVESPRDRTEIAFGALEVNAPVPSELMKPPLR